MENIKQVIGKKLQDRRVEKGFKTQKALADAIGVDRTRVVRWESGQNTPDPIYKDLLSKALDVPLSFFETIEIPTKKAPEIVEIPAPLESIQKDLKDIKSKLDQKNGPSMSPDQEKLVRLISGLNDKQTARAIRFVNTMLSEATLDESEDGSGAL